MLPVISLFDVMLFKHDTYKLLVMAYKWLSYLLNQHLHSHYYTCAW